MDDSNQKTSPPSPFSSQVPNLQVPSISSQPIQRASARPHRSRGLLHNKKRLKTLGPPRRVLISNSDSDNSSSKCMELEDSFVEKLSPVFETNDREIEVVSLESGVNSDTEQQGMSSSFNHGRERVEEASVSREISEHRKRKAGEANQDNSISLVLSMNSPASHYESDEDHIFSQHGHEQFDIAEFRSGRHVIDVKSKTPCFQKLNVQENLSANSSRNPKFSADCNVVKQNLFEKPSFKTYLSNPVAAESSRRVHFSVLESSSRADDMELSDKFGMDKQIYKTHGSCVNVKSHSEYTDPFRSDADQHDDQKMSLDLYLTGGSLQKAYEMVAIDTGVEKLQTHLNSLSLTENQGHKVLGNSEQLFTSLEECAKLSQPSTQQRDYDNAAMDFQDKRSNSMATTGAGKGKALNTFNSECFSCISSASVTSSSTSSQGEPVSLALSSATSQKEALESNRNLNLTSPPHGSLDNKRSGFCESLIASESQHVPRSTFVTQSLAGQSTVATATTSLTRQDLSTEQQFSFKDNDERRLQMQVNTAKCQNPKALVKLEKNDNLKSHLTYKTIEEKDCEPEIAQGLETSRQPSVSQLNMDKKDNRETSTSLKKHIDPDAFFKVNRRLYQKLGKIGSGGSSEVYKVIASDCTIYALKKIKLKGRDYSTAYGFCQEIDYLTKLRGKNYIIQLVDYEITSKTILRDLRIAESKAKDGKINEDAYIYMVLEYGEVDLAQMLSQKWKESDVAGTQIDENWLRYYWQQILMAVNTIHEQRIVHSDLKPANFLLVKGVLKLIDFGIAKAIQSDTTNIQRESQVGTLNYMSPEAFMCNDTDENGNIIKCGRPSDIWSLGCILYQMVYGKTPFAAFTSFWSKFKEITNKNHKISFPPVSNPWLLDIMKKCLAWDRNDRLRIPQLLSHPFLKPPITTACPSMEEKYCRYLSEISEVYNANAEIKEMCEKLKSSLGGKHEKASELE